MTKPLIVAFVNDALGGDEMARTAAGLGFELHFVGESGAVAPAGLADVPYKLGEAVEGRDGALFAWLVDRQPALLVFDLDNEHIPWRRWIPALKASPATRRMPVVAYAADAAVEGTAVGSGADHVLGRGQFTAAWPALIQQWARIPDYAALAGACAEPLSALGRKGLALFNEGAYYECHHALEAAWNEDTGAGRNLYKGILQVAVAYYQIERGNYNGAIKLILRMRQWLDPLPEVCRGVHIGRLRHDALAVYAALQALGRERIGELDQNLLQPVHYEEP